LPVALLQSPQQAASRIKSAQVGSLQMKSPIADGANLKVSGIIPI